MKKPSRGLIGYIVLIAAFILMAVLLSGGKSTGGEITYPDLLKNVQDGKVEYVAVRGQNLYGLYYDSVRSRTSTIFTALLALIFWIPCAPWPRRTRVWIAP